MSVFTEADTPQPLDDYHEQVTALRAVRAEIKRLGDIESDLRAELIKALDDHEFGTVMGLPALRYQLVPPPRKIDIGKLEQRFPDVFELCLRTDVRPSYRLVLL